ncbi:unnamed protein product, partial [Lepeophtheirus salmonis]
EDKVIDVFDDEEESWGDSPYSDLKSKIHKEYKISAQEKMEILFKLIDNPVAPYVTEIVSHARNYFSNITNLWEAITQQIPVWSLPNTQRSGLSVHFVDVSSWKRRRRMFLSQKKKAGKESI